jgi:hypothetical protein
LLKGFASGGGFAATWLEPKKGPRTVEPDRRGRITCYRSPTPGVSGTCTLCGLHLLSPEVFDFLPEDKPFCTLVEVFERRWRATASSRAWRCRGDYWTTRERR